MIIRPHWDRHTVGSRSGLGAQHLCFWESDDKILGILQIMTVGLQTKQDGMRGFIAEVRELSSRENKLGSTSHPLAQLIMLPQPEGGWSLLTERPVNTILLIHSYI